MPTRHRIVRAAALVVGGAVVAGCGGGGGQLAQSETSGTSARAPAAIRAVPASRLPAPDSPAAAARALTEVETALRTDGLDASSARRLGRRQQQAYRALGAHPRWLPRVLAAVPGRVRAAVESNAAAGAALASLTGTGSGAPSQLPNRRILTGPMQFIPATWAAFGEGDIQSNHDAIQAAGRYLAARGGAVPLPEGWRGP